jgi:hypothetical protein
MGSSSRVAARVRATSSRAGIADTSGWDSSIVTVQAQWGLRSAGSRGGRWIGRTCAFGLVATAVASKVGSSMSWHIERT